MKKRSRFYIANSILWAAAIIASAVVHAPTVLSLILLPVLAAGSLLFMDPKFGQADGPAVKP